MRAKNEVKFLAEAYTAVAGGWHENGINRRIILERVVDGVLMCPEACCGKPVMECKCGPDCPHCNCHEIQKLAKKDKTISEYYEVEDDDYNPVLNAAARSIIGTTVTLSNGHTGKIVDVDVQSGYMVVKTADGNTFKAELGDDDIKYEDNELHLQGTNFAAEPPPVDEEDIFPNSEYGRSLRRDAKQHEQEDKEDRAKRRREEKQRYNLHSDVLKYVKNKDHGIYKKNEDNEYIDHDDPKWDVEMSDVDKEEFGSEPKRGVRAPKLPDLKSGIRRLDDVIKRKQRRP
tara:strand:- start:896 stop:1756 length:861 start_codon:yes stop_codon:yes gene_type:complete